MIKLKQLIRETLEHSLDYFTKAYIEAALKLSDSSYTYNHGEPQKRAWEPGSEWKPGYENDKYDVDPNDNEPSGEKEYSGRPLDETYTVDDIDPDTLNEMIRDCQDFQKKYEELYESAGWDSTQAGYDFWLTRNHHGAGFWCRDSSDLSNTTLFQEKGEDGIEAVGKILTDAAHAYGEYHLYLGDGAYDGMVCGSKG